MIASPSLEDFSVLSDLFMNGVVSAFCLECSDRDGGFEVVETEFGFGLLGSEDSARGHYFFQLHDRTKSSEVVTAEIHELPLTAFTHDKKAVVQIASTYFQKGELDARCSWLLNVDLGGHMKYGIHLPKGYGGDVVEFISELKSRCAVLPAAANEQGCADEPERET